MTTRLSQQDLDELDRFEKDAGPAPLYIDQGVVIDGKHARTMRTVSMSGADLRFVFALWRAAPALLEEIDDWRNGRMVDGQSPTEQAQIARLKRRE